ncbi:MAG: 50S ribosome-binding GTPase, partial [Sandaracinaceae bacterium]|nr:50S ribosome-binding GTPase [Sandaracinaceae bacterium]
MPHIDKRTGQVVIRVVYDGAPEAGKTTNIQELAKGMSLSRRSEVVSPRSTSRRTEFFDWLTFTGGFVDGRRLGCQLVSVPGQPSLLRRRRYLLDSADVVVFVADARPELTSLNRELFDWMRSMLEKRRVHAVVQANKQDLQSSLRPHDLASALGLSDATPILGASAALGEGVMQTFITAVRLGTARVLELVTSGGWDGLSPQEESAQDLLAALETAEAELFAQQVELDRARKLDTRGEPAGAP